MTEPLRTFDQQKIAGHDQLFRTLGVPAVYVNAAGDTKNIIVIFRNREAETDDGATRLIAPEPVIRTRDTDIDDRDRDTATFAINSITYRPDRYVDNGHGLLKIYLRL